MAARRTELWIYCESIKAIFSILWLLMAELRMQSTVVFRKPAAPIWAYRNADDTYLPGAVSTERSPPHRLYPRPHRTPQGRHGCTDRSAGQGPRHRRGETPISR